MWKATQNVKILVLSHPLGDLGVTYMVHLWLVGKRVVDFILVLIELLSLAITVEALWADIGRNRVRQGGGSLSAQISGGKGKGRPSRRLKSRKLQVKSSHEVVTRPIPGSRSSQSIIDFLVSWPIPLPKYSRKCIYRPSILIKPTDWLAKQDTSQPSFETASIVFITFLLSDREFWPTTQTFNSDLIYVKDHLYISEHTQKRGKNLRRRWKSQTLRS